MGVSERRATPALLQVDAILTRLQGRNALAEVCRFLVHEFTHYPWVGVYRLEGTTLVLEAYNGPEATEHVRIPIEKGICGQAARENRTVIVDDVQAAPEYLACFVSTRSEIVVPVRDGPAVIGEIDIDGHQVKAFDGSDRAFLEKVAKKLVAPLQKSATERPQGARESLSVVERPEPAGRSRWRPGLQVPREVAEGACQFVHDRQVGLLIRAGERVQVDRDDVLAQGPKRLGAVAVLEGNDAEVRLEDPASVHLRPVGG
jgi:L-methionine (R)-S-oxide reductase